MDDLVPICCFCFKVRDEKNMEASGGPWVDLNTYAIRRQLPLSYRFVFTHGYCPIASPILTSAWRPIVRRLSGSHCEKQAAVSLQELRETSAWAEGTVQHGHCR